MKFWEQFRKKQPNSPQQGYQRQKSTYDKQEELQKTDREPDPGRPSDNDDALKRLLEDDEIRQRVQEEVAASSHSENNSLGQMLGKGVGTLGDSLKKVSTGQSLLDETSNDRKNDRKKDRKEEE